MLDNFGFVKNYDPALYNAIHEAEQKLKIDFVEAGSLLRKEVVEFFINNLIERNNLETELSDFCSSHTPVLNSGTLYSQMCFLTNRKAIKNLNNPRIHPLVCMHKTKKGFVEYKVSAKYIDQKGQEVYRKIEPNDEEIEAFAFLRWAGNSCSHNKLNKEQPMLNLAYENVLEAFKVTYHMLACHFNDNAKYGKYHENRVPFGDFCIDRAFIPNDSTRTGCIMEYEAKKQLEEKTEWAIIREYAKNDMDKNFFLRGYDTTIFTKYQLIDVPNAMVEVHNLTKFDSEAPYYTIAYVFTRKPQKIIDTLNQISLENRYDICLRIAKCFEVLHTNSMPLYHRMLNHNCIYTQDCKDVGRDWVASVLKFDFSKIPDKGEQKTVFHNAWHAQEKILDESEKKYIAPEWTLENRNADWGKVDIFSLGILFCDILCGTILPNSAAIEKAFSTMLNLGIKRELIEIIFNMTSEMLDERPLISEVVLALQKYR